MHTSTKRRRSVCYSRVEPMHNHTVRTAPRSAVVDEGSTPCTVQLCNLHITYSTTVRNKKLTAIADGPRDAPCQTKSCQLQKNSLYNNNKSSAVNRLDKNLSMNNHVNAVCKSVHYHIRALRHIRSSISEDMAKIVACALVGSRLDYANSGLFGATQKNIFKLQKPRTSSPVLLPVLLNPAVHVLSSSSSTGSRLNTTSTSK